MTFTYDNWLKIMSHPLLGRTDSLQSFIIKTGMVCVDIFFDIFLTFPFFFFFRVESCNKSTYQCTVSAHWFHTIPFDMFRVCMEHYTLKNNTSDVKLQRDWEGLMNECIKIGHTRNLVGYHCDTDPHMTCHSHRTAGCRYSSRNRSCSGTQHLHDTERSHLYTHSHLEIENIHI